MREHAASKHLLRIKLEIPVEQIEVMHHLVHEQAAGDRALGVPAAEVIGAVLHVEVPMEIDRYDVADRARAQQFLDGARGRREAVVECNIDTPAGAALGIEDACALLAVVAIGFSVMTSTPVSSAATM